MLYPMDHPRHRRKRGLFLEPHPGGVAFMADAASMDHAANGIPREVGFAVANR
jgi:hypothetical protein